jgi:hypothetical protein
MIIAGQPSWRIASADVEAHVTELGGHLAPVIYDRRGKRIAPFALAPWAGEPPDPSLPPILQVLRGDFFCLPFGGNETPFRGEKHPVHGETANARWTLQDRQKTREGSTLHLRLRTKIRPGRVDKFISVREGHPAVYSRHVISEMAGPMSFGHHAILKFPPRPGSGLISTSPFRFGQVFVRPTESPEKRGYSALQPGAKFKSLAQVPTIFGSDTDLSTYPARRGYEDIVTVVSDPTLPFAWTAVSFPAENYAWFALKNPRVLAETLLWISNGGRHYPPWNGRHVDTMGLEEVTSYFHTGLAESAKKNSLSHAGFPTSVTLDPKRPLVVNYIMAAVPTPRGFDRIGSITALPDRSGVKLTSASGKTVKARIDLTFLGGLTS